MIRRWRACQTRVYDLRTRIDVARAVLQGRPVIYRMAVRGGQLGRRVDQTGLYAESSFSEVRFR